MPDSIDVFVVEDDASTRDVLASQLRDTVECNDVCIYECADGIPFANTEQDST